MSQHKYFNLAAISTAIVQILLSYTLLASANYQQAPDDNVYQREHSLVKPYQGSGMVSNDCVDSVIPASQS